MLTISKPLNPGQLKHYHDKEFSAARENYYTAHDQIVGTWHGRLAEAFGLAGDVNKLHFDRLADGQHPITVAQLVQAKTSRLTPDGKQTMEHRAGWDLTFSAPKSASITGLVGGDERVRQAHISSVSVALKEVERYTQSRRGGATQDPEFRHVSETTSNWVAARFEHDSARPVDGYSAPQLHTHTVVFNMTERLDGTIAPIQSYEWLQTQALATAIYRSELALNLQALGYKTAPGQYGQPEIVGYTDAYLEAASPRRKQILDKLEETERHGAGAAQIAAHQTREKKTQLSPEIVKAQHQEMAGRFGNQPTHVVREAQRRGPVRHRDIPHHSAHAALLYARDRNNEKAARNDERTIKRDALARGMGWRTAADIFAEFERKVTDLTFVEVAQDLGVPGRTFTTPEMLALERENISTMRAGQHTQPALASADIRRDVQYYDRLNESQRTAVEQVLANRDRFQAMDGIAGSGKTTALAAIRDAAEREGFVVRGLAPTTRAVQELNDAGIQAHTLQRHLERADDELGQKKRLWVLDESSLSSSLQAHRFLETVRKTDRVIFVGDTRQHEAVEAGRPYAQLQDAGIAVARLDAIVRQRHAGLKATVEDLAAGRIKPALDTLQRDGRVHEFQTRADRYAAIADEYVKEPDRTLVISPANDERQAINTVIHETLQAAGRVDRREVVRSVLVPRQDLTGADRKWAKRYHPGDVLRYTKGSEFLRLGPGEFARVTRVEAAEHQNRLTVRTDSGRTVTYDPVRLSAVTVYQEQERRFARGDRVQFTAPHKADRIANRQRGVITLANNRELAIRLDGTGRIVAVPASGHQHLDYGYAVTSHSSQGQTTDIVLVHVDVDQPKTLVNQRMGYVAISRARDDAQIFTNDRGRLAKVLGRHHDTRSALSQAQTAAHSTDQINAV